MIKVTQRRGVLLRFTFAEGGFTPIHAAIMNSGAAPILVVSMTARRYVAFFSEEGAAAILGQFGEELKT